MGKPFTVFPVSLFSRCQEIRESSSCPSVTQLLCSVIYRKPLIANLSRYIIQTGYYAGTKGMNWECPQSIGTYSHSKQT